MCIRDSALCANTVASADDRQLAQTLFESFGKCEWVDEPLINAVIAASGSSPAYIFLLMEAMADGAVRYGIPRSQAYTCLLYTSIQPIFSPPDWQLFSGFYPLPA